MCPYQAGINESTLQQGKSGGGVSSARVDAALGGWGRRVLQ